MCHCATRTTAKHFQSLLRRKEDKKLIFVYMALGTHTVQVKNDETIKWNTQTESGMLIKHRNMKLTRKQCKKMAKKVCMYAIFVTCFFICSFVVVAVQILLIQIKVILKLFVRVRTCMYMHLQCTDVCRFEKFKCNVSNKKSKFVGEQ